MKTTLTMTRGLPASGKSTWAKQAVLDAPAGTTIRVNKDDLRKMLHAKRHSPENEKQVLQARDLIIAASLKDGVNVIVDDTNFSPYHERRLREFATEFGADFIVKDFTDVPVGLCIERDEHREDYVGAQVIIEMNQKYLGGLPAEPVRPL